MINYINRISALVLVVVAFSFANRFYDLEEEMVFSKSSILLHSILYQDSSAIYLNDIKEYLNSNSVSDGLGDKQVFENDRPEIGFYRTEKISIPDFVLELSKHLCLNDRICKDLLWKKRLSKSGYMNLNMIKTLSVLCPERLTTMLSEFKKYPYNYWQINSLVVLSIYSENSHIDVKVADTLKNMLRGFQREWNNKPSNMKNYGEQEIYKLDVNIEAQVNHNIDTLSKVIDKDTYCRSYVYENLISNGTKQEICIEFNSDRNIGRIFNRWTGTANWITYLISDYCNALSSQDRAVLNEVIKNSTNYTLVNVDCAPTPMIYKLMKEYNQKQNW